MLVRDLLQRCEDLLDEVVAEAVQSRAITARPSILGAPVLIPRDDAPRQAAAASAAAIRSFEGMHPVRAQVVP
jgi:hypothetical protein